MDLHEIAQTMGLEFSTVKRKRDELKKANEISDTTICRLVKVGFAGPKEVASYVLSVEDAKFFVAGYNNEVGHAKAKLEKNLEDYPTGVKILIQQLIQEVTGHSG